MLRFEPEAHKYFWNDKEVPSVSQILKGIGITRDYEKVDEFYRLRGTYVHQAVQFHVKRTLDEDTLDQENVLPYLKAFKKFESEKGYKVSASEVPLYSEQYGFAGTLDQLGSFDYGEEGITELKATENSDKAADLQVCGYAQLYFENFGKWPFFRMVLELHGDETSTPIYYKTDPTIWDSVMNLWKWKTTRRKKDENH